MVRYAPSNYIYLSCNAFYVQLYVLWCVGRFCQKLTTWFQKRTTWWTHGVHCCWCAVGRQYNMHLHVRVVEFLLRLDHHDACEKRIIYMSITIFIQYWTIFQLIIYLLIVIDICIYMYTNDRNIFCSEQSIRI